MTGAALDVAGEAEALLAALARWVPALLPDAARAAAIVDACRGAVAAAGPTAELRDVVAAVEAAAQAISRHVVLALDEAGSLEPPAGTDDHGWPAPDLRAIRRRAGSVSEVARTADGIATVRIDALDPLDVAEPFLEAACALADRAAAVVLDLRANGGGDVATASFLAAWLLGPGAHPLAHVHGADGVGEWPSAAPPAHLHVPAGVPVAVLTSAATFSAAEAIAHQLQVRRRAAVVGERTPGAADLATAVVLTRFVHAQLPVASVVDAETGSSWEQVGVVPDVPCDAGDAHDAALTWLRARLGAR